MESKRLLASEPYVYEELPKDPGSIRLVKITTEAGSIAGSYPRTDSVPLRDKSKPEDFIVCYIEAFAPDQTPTYDALSYTWGCPLGIFQDDKQKENMMRAYDEQLCIICNGRVMEVGKNLYDALVFLWAGHRTGGGLEQVEKGLRLEEYIWIDAMCIDQKNMEEGNEQVKLMDQIYRRAEKSIIWIGAEDSTVGRVVDVIGAIGRAPSLLNNPKRFASSKPLWTRDHSEEGLPAFSREDWVCVFLFYSRTWFHRMWILQEAILSRKTYVFCGFYYFQWHFLALAADFLSASGWASDIISDARHYFNFEINRSIFNTPRYISETRCALGLQSYLMPVGAVKPPSILSLLQDFRSADCKEPKDKIYAIRGIMSGTPQSSIMEKITIDYKIQDWKVFLEAAWAILCSSKNLDLLSHAQVPSEVGVPGLPSWVPDWTMKEPSVVIRNKDFDDPNGNTIRWNACADVVWEQPIMQDLPLTLAVQGKRIGVIRDVVSFADFKDITPLARVTKHLQNMSKLYPPMDMGLKSSPYAPKPQTRFEAFWRTLAMDIWDHTCPAPQELGRHFAKTIIYMHMFMPLEAGFLIGMEKQVRNWEVLKALSGVEQGSIEAYAANAAPFAEDPVKLPTKHMPVFTGSMMDGNWGDFKDEVADHIADSITTWRNLQSRKPVLVSDNGLLGVGPEIATEGDELWVLAGARVPFVLRTGKEKGVYTLVGEAYVHGIMHGEALREEEKLEEIIIG